MVSSVRCSVAPNNTQTGTCLLLSLHVHLLARGAPPATLLQSCHWLGPSLLVLAATLGYCLLRYSYYPMCFAPAARLPLARTRHAPSSPASCWPAAARQPAARQRAARSRSHALVSPRPLRCWASALFGSSADSVRWKSRTEAEADHRNS